MKKILVFVTSALMATSLLVGCNSRTEESSIVDIDWKTDYKPIETLSKRMPGEFEAQEGIMMCYKNNMPLSAYKTIAKDNKLIILTNPDEQNISRIDEAKQAFINEGIDLSNIEFIDIDLDRDIEYWVRDFSPFFVYDENELSMVNFTYNRPARVEQNVAPKKLSNVLNMSISDMDIVHTGGNLMQDGRGTAFSDDLVLKENNGNEKKVREQMKTYTGTDRYVITIDPQGLYIAHVDCWAKIVAPDKIIMAKVPESNERYKYYEQVYEELSKLDCCYGYPYRIYRIDEPGGETVAPYTNSLIANDKVYMPLGEDEEYNKKAIDVYKEALPGYEIIGVEGFPITNDEYDDDNLQFWNSDALHCRTHEIPDRNALFIDSRDVLHGEIKEQDYYLAKANVVSYGKELIEKVQIHYSINNAPYLVKDMERYLDTGNYVYPFTELKKGDDVNYFITASTSNKQTTDPTCGEKDPHHFIIA